MHVWDEYLVDAWHTQIINVGFVRFKVSTDK